MIKLVITIKEKNEKSSTVTIKQPSEKEFNNASLNEKATLGTVYNMICETLQKENN